MLYANIKQIDKHDYLAERFRKGYEFLRSADLMSLPVGRVDIDGDDVYASVQEYITLPDEECRYEAHDKYYDIQYVAAGREKFGCVKREGLTETESYDPEKDMVFFENPKYESYVVLEAGDCRQSPQDCGEGAGIEERRYPPSGLSAKNGDPPEGILP